MANIFSSLLNTGVKKAFNYALRKYPQMLFGEPVRPDRKYRKDGVMTQVMRLAQGYYIADITKWKQAVAQAENVDRPRRRALVQTYTNSFQDLHVQSEINVRKLRVSGRKFTIVDKSDKHLDDKAKIFQAPWFKDFMSYALDSLFWGTELIEFGPIVNNMPLYVVKTPQEHYSPREGVVLVNPYDTEGIDITQFRKSIVEIGDPASLGLLKDISLAEIKKRSMERAWLDFAERFGQPLRVAKTTSRNPEDLNAIDTYLENAGEANWLRVPEGTSIEIHATSSTDAYEVYLRYIEHTEKKISKAVLGQTEATNNDGKGSYAKATIHDEILDDITSDDIAFIEGVVNFTLIPFLMMHGVPLEGCTFKFEDSVTISPTDRWNMVLGLLQNGYQVDEQYIMKEFNIPIKLKAQVQPPPKPIQNQLPQPQNFMLPLMQGTTSEANYRTYMGATAVPQMVNIVDDDPMIAVFEKMCKDLYNGNASKTDIYQAFTHKLTEIYGRAIDTGYEVGLNYDYQDKEQTLFLKKNAFIFSGAKNLEETQVLGALLLDKDNNIRPFKDFYQDAKALHGTYNRNFLDAEYQYAVAAAQQASQWLDIEAQQDLFPLLEYDAVNDDRTRPEHAALDKIVRTVGDSFWNNNYPPNGWRCRCTVRQLRAGEKPVTDNPPTPDIPVLFKNNVGRSGIIFKEEHPYFQSVTPQAWVAAKQQLLADKSEALYIRTYTYSKGHVDTHLNHLKDEIKINLPIAKRLAEMGNMQVRLRPYSFAPGEKNPDALVMIDNNWLVADFMEFDNPTNIASALQRKISKANNQGAEVAIIYANTEVELSVEELNRKLVLSLDGRNKAVNHIIIIYPNEKVVKLSRKDILAGKAKAQLLPFGTKK